MEIIILIGIGAIVVLNAVATSRVVRDDLSTNGQKLGQVLVVWLLPILGALLIFWTKKEKLDRPIEKKTTLHDPDPLAGGINLRSAAGEADIVDPH